MMFSGMLLTSLLFNDVLHIGKSMNVGSIIYKFNIFQQSLIAFFNQIVCNKILFSFSREGQVLECSR